MNDFEKLALAGLVHDLPALLEVTQTPDTRSARQILDLASLENPASIAVLNQAETYAMPENGDRRLFLDQPLVSIFSSINIRQADIKAPAYHKLTPLAATSQSQEDIFPTAEPDMTGLQELVSKFASELDWLGSSLDPGNFDLIYPHLLAVLQRFAWCIPGHSPDVSLFDHAKLTSAIAACLYRFHESNLSVEAIQSGIERERFCLIVGDLSGIQNYIFDIATTGAGGVARRLRARSFFISLLSDAISHQVAFRFGVPLGNTIMSSGGKFYVLVPNTGDLALAIERFRHEVDAWFREKFNAEIALNLAYACFPIERFYASRQGKPGFGEVVSDLSIKLNREKHRRGQSTLVREGRWDEPAFVVQREFWGAGICISCGKFPGTRPDGACEQCDRDRRIGRKLPRVQYVAYYRQLEDGEDAIPMPDGYSARVLTGNEVQQAGNPYLVASLNQPQMRELASYPGTFRYLANYVPLGEHGEQLSFDEIASMSTGRHLLGYVKADVDHLGLLFAQGLRRDEAGGYDTAAQLAAFSRQLDLFFSGWMQHLLSQTTDYRGFYTIFSGGDDLFLAGPWDKTAALARTLHDRFTDFVVHNPDITLSAGLLFTKDRYPISRASQDAEQVLEKSKEHIWFDPEGRQQNRNQLALLGDILTWDAAPAVFAEIQRLQAYSKKFTSAFLYDLVEYARLYKLWVDEGKIEGLRYKPLFAYNIARNLRKEKDEDLYQWADQLVQSLHGGVQNLTMQHLGLIATYLLFIRRNHEHE